MESSRKTITVLLVENNPDDRIVIEETLADSEFELRFSEGVHSVHENDRYVDLLEKDPLGDEYPIVLFDLGLSNKEEWEFVKEKTQKWLRDGNNLVNYRMLIRTNKGDESVPEVATKGTLGYLLTRLFDVHERLYGIVSNYVSESNRRTLQYIITLERGWLSQDGEKEIDANRKPLGGLVFNKVKTKDMLKNLRDAYAIWPQQRPAARYSPLTYWPAIDLKQEDNHPEFFATILMRALTQQDSEHHKRKRTKPDIVPVILILDPLQELMLWHYEKWEKILRRHGYKLKDIIKNEKEFKAKYNVSNEESFVYFDNIDHVFVPQGLFLDIDDDKKNREFCLADDMQLFTDYKPLARTTHAWPLSINVYPRLPKLQDALISIPFDYHGIVLLPQCWMNEDDRETWPWKKVSSQVMLNSNSDKWIISVDKAAMLLQKENKLLTPIMLRKKYCSTVKNEGTKKETNIREDFR
jgi:hypothetical protein